MSKIPLVYIAGPFRGPTNADVEWNIQVASVFRAPIARAGGMPICVHINEGLAMHDIRQENNGAWWVEATLEVMRCCDAVVLVPGWQTSEGTRGEFTAALAEGIPVFDASWVGPSHTLDVKYFGQAPKPAPVSTWYQLDSFKLVGNACEYEYANDLGSFDEWIETHTKGDGT